MEYYTTAELAKKWGITQRKVAIYCREGCSEGAMLKGRTWLIPGNVEKPVDPRRIQNNAVNKLAVFMVHVRKRSMLKVTR